MSTDCIFCKLIAGDIPRQVLYEDELVIAFLNIHPVSPGHFLVAPKKHVTDILTADSDTYHAVMAQIKKITKAAIEAAGAESFNLVYNHDQVAGQSIPHMHWHVIPRRTDDGLLSWESDSTEYAQGEWELFGERMRDALKGKE